jgi:hypothetical protein
MLAAFLDQIECIPWFRRVGVPILSSDVKRISDWSQWPGPEDPSVSQVYEGQQALHDELMDVPKDTRISLEELWETIRKNVFRVAQGAVPYRQGQDSWYAPNAALWHATWTAGLIGLCYFLGREIPPELREQWTWFSAGHWPCAWEGDYPSGRPVVY